MGKGRKGDSIDSTEERSETSEETTKRRKRKMREGDEGKEEEKLVEEEEKIDGSGVNPMEKRKKRRGKEKDRIKSTSTGEEQPTSVQKDKQMVGASSSTKCATGLHMEVFRNLASVEASVREAAAETLVKELQEDCEKSGDGEIVREEVLLEANKDDGLRNCAPSLRYAVRRLVRGVSSSRECARQGFAMALTVVVGRIKSIRIESILEVIGELLEVTSSMKGQESRECLLGQLFAYGAVARSGRLAEEWRENNGTPVVKKFIGHLISLADQKSYLREPAVSVIVDLAEKLPVDAISTHVFEDPAVSEWVEKAIDGGYPDALLLALKLRQMVPADTDLCCKLLPSPFSSNTFFTREHLSSIIPCLREATFSHPRMHSLWPLLKDILLSDLPSKEDDDASTKPKKSRKRNSPEKVLAKRIDCFTDVVIDGCLLSSSHERKHLAFDLVCLLLPTLPASCIDCLLSKRLIQCLMDVLSTNDSWLYKMAQHFIQELFKFVERGDEHRVGVTLALQHHSFGRFDSITRTTTVKSLVHGINSGTGCILFVRNLMALFVDGKGSLGNDTTKDDDEVSEMDFEDDKESLVASSKPDVLRSWIADNFPRVLKLKLDSETKLLIQKEIMKFLTVQGLFAASLGTVVTSFELQEKLKWPKTASSSYVRKICVEQLQLLLSDAQKAMGAQSESNKSEFDDVGTYFMHFLNTLCNIPSVSLFWSLGNEDEDAFKKLKSLEAQLGQMEINGEADRMKLRTMRFLCIQLLLQILLRPGEFHEAASELVICCTKAFTPTIDCDFAEEEDNSDDEGDGKPVLMDVLVDNLLSLLPQSSAPTLYSVEQVFRIFCNGITEAGLISMLRIIRRNLKPARHQAVADDEADDYDSEDDFLGIEDSEEMDLAENEHDVGSEISDDGNGEEDGAETETPVALEENQLETDESDGGDDDEAMFRNDALLARLFKEKAGGDTAQAQLVLFKLRVLSLLEIFLQKNSENPLVLVAYSHLMPAFVNSHSIEGTQQLRQRISGVLQKKLFKAQDYPKSNTIQLSAVETQLGKSLRLASRTRIKDITPLAQNASFWLLKVLHGNFSESDLQGVLDLFRNVLEDYFGNKKCRLKSGFVKEVFRRYPWMGERLFSFLLEKCINAKWEYRRTEALGLADSVLKHSCTKHSATDAASSVKLPFLKENLPLLGDLIQQLFSKPVSKGSKRSDIRRFSVRALQLISQLKLKKSFLKSLKPDAYAAFESFLGDLFLPFKKCTLTQEQQTTTTDPL